jgi:hypothetical protein
MNCTYSHNKIMNGTEVDDLPNHRLKLFFIDDLALEDVCKEEIVMEN